MSAKKKIRPSFQPGYFIKLLKTDPPAYYSLHNFIYRIGGYRTPLLIRTPVHRFCTHNGNLWQFFVQYHRTFGLKIVENDQCEWTEID